MVHHATPTRLPGASRVAVLLVAAALAVLMGLLLADGGAPVGAAVTAAVAGFGAFAGAYRLLTPA